MKVQLFGAAQGGIRRRPHWTDDDTVAIVKEYNDANPSGWRLDWTPDATYASLAEATTAADGIWDAFWAPDDGSYRDCNPESEWQFVVAVFADDDELGERPLYTRGYYRSVAAPWNAHTR